MLTFLVWNVAGVASPRERNKGGVRPLLPQNRRYHRLRRLLCLAAFQEKVDVIVVVESPFNGNLALPGFEMVPQLAPANSRTSCRLEIYHRSTTLISDPQVFNRAVLHQLRTAASETPLLLVAVHLDSPLYVSEATRKRRVEELALDIRNAEKLLGTRSTLVVGDFNFDPHDPAMTDAYGFNATPARVVAELKERALDRTTVPYFYNPMWAHISGVGGGPPGSFYRRTRDVDCRVWYLPDQVLLRPDVFPYWKKDGVRILTKIGKQNLLDNKSQPNRKAISDHLPVLFTLDLP